MAKELQLFGIGSAIVDIQLQISQEEFDMLGLAKGTMNLVDAERQRHLLTTFRHHNSHKCSGGSAANTAIAFAQFGGRSGFGTMLGMDELGDFYAHEFQHLGIHLVAPVIEGSDTGTSVIFITPDSERTMNTSLAVNTGYAKNYVPETTIKNSEWLYFESFKLTEPNGVEAINTAIDYAKHHNTKIAVSFSDTFIVNIFGDQLRHCVQNADLIFCNRTEAAAYTGTTDVDTMFGMLTKEAKNIVLTMSESGARVLWENQEYTIPAVPTSPIDATGAGDMYAAGFLYGITHGFTIPQSGLLASKAASKVISQLGARLHQEDIDTIRTSV